MIGLLVSQICFLAAHAPLELTRLILHWRCVKWGLTDEFIFELVFIWLLYGVAVFVISVIAQRYVGQKKGVEKGDKND